MWLDLKKKNWLPHTQYHIYNFSRNALLAQCTIIFHWVPCSKVTSLVSMEAFPRLCISLDKCFGTISWSWPMFRWLREPWRAGQCLSPSVWNAVSTKKVHQNPKLDLWPPIVFILYFILLYWAHPPPLILATTCNIITLMKKAAQNSLGFGLFT